MTDFDESLRQQLRAELEEFGRSQADLARYLGVDRSVVSKMLSGRRLIKAAEQAKIREYLRITLPDLADPDLVRLRPDSPPAGTVRAAIAGGNDYLLVLTHAALVERALKPHSPGQAWISQENVQRAVARSGYGGAEFGDRMQALFELRDEFVHSSQPRSLDEPELQALLGRIIIDGSAPPDGPDDRRMRMAFVISCAAFSHLVELGAETEPQNGRNTAAI